MERLNGHSLSFFFQSQRGIFKVHDRGIVNVNGRQCFQNYNGNDNDNDYVNDNGRLFWKLLLLLHQKLLVVLTI